MQVFFRILLGALVALMAVNSVASADTSLSRVLKRKQLRVAADLSSMPWFYENARTGELHGFEYEILVEIARKISPEIQIEIVSGDWEKLKLDVFNDRADVLMNAWFRPGDADTHSEERWSRCYYKTGLGVIFSSRRTKAPTVENLSQGRLFLFADNHAIEVAKKLGLKNYHLTTEDMRVFQQIERGTADYFVYDIPYLRYYAHTGNGRLKVADMALPGSEGCYAMMAPRGSESLMRAIDQAILEIEPSVAGILRKYGL